MKIAMKITYDGTAFCGWQKQPGKLSVEEEIGSAIEKILGEKITLYASGRTDAGVHALGQVAHFETQKKVNISSFASSVNAYLNKFVKIICAWVASDDFDARFSAKEKTYVYKFYVSKFELPLKLNRELRVNDNIDILLMQSAVKDFIGTHDFSSFVARKSGKTNFVRTIFDAQINKTGENDYELRVTGNGFLYNMIRIMMGTLIDIGMKRKTDIKQIIQAKDRTKAGKTMPPYALYLKEVKYV